MEFTIQAKRPQADKARGSMYDKVVDTALDLDEGDEVAIAKNGKKHLRHTLYQLIHRKQLALKVSEDATTVYLSRTATYEPQKKRS